jgi:hypothetical protein
MFMTFNIPHPRILDCHKSLKGFRAYLLTLKKFWVPMSTTPLKLSFHHNFVIMYCSQHCSWGSQDLTIPPVNMIFTQVEYIQSQNNCKLVNISREKHSPTTYTAYTYTIRASLAREFSLCVRPCKNNFSHPSLVTYFFATPPIKLELVQQINRWGGLLIANHLDESLW